MHGLTASALRASSHPIILHVRRPGHGTTYAHWVLFLGVEGDKARIVDPPNSVQLLPFSELLALWDGAGLVMSKEPIATTQIQAGAWIEQIVLLFLVGAVLGIARAIQHRYSLTGRWLWPFLGLPAAALAGAGAYHLIHDDGFFHNRVAVAQVAGRYFKPALPALSVDEVAAILNQPDVTLIDARFPEDYRRGHLKGAINLPVYSGLVERAELLGAVPESNRVILYCQSEACGWGEAIASDLVLRGYRNVYLFPGGWRQWVQHERSKRQD